MQKYFTLFLGLIVLGSCTQNSSTHTPNVPEEITHYWYAGVGQFNGSLDFGNLETKTSKLLTVSVKNIGDATINGPASVTGTGFSLSYSNCATLLVGKTCSLKISFSPQNLPNGLYTGSVFLGSSEGNLSAGLSIPTPPEDIRVSVGGIPLDQNGTLEFGTFRYNQSVLKTLIIENKGQESVTYQAVLANDLYYHIAYDQCSAKEIKPKQSCSLKISISGNGLNGAVQDYLSFGDINLLLNSQVRNLETVASEESDVKLIIDNLARTAGPVDLGTWNLNQTKILNLFLKNEGSQPGIIQSPTLPENFPLVYNNCPAGNLLMANTSCLMKAALIPQAKGNLSAEVVFQGQTYNLQSIIREPGDKIACGITHALTSWITWTGNTYSPCIVEECNSGYSIDNNTCIPNELNVTINQPPVHQGSISGPSSVLYDSSALFNFTPAPNYQIISWLNDCSGSTNTCELEEIQNDLTVGINVGCVGTHILVGDTCVKGIVQNGDSRNWSDGTYAQSCSGYTSPPGGYTYAGFTGAGTYTILPAGESTPYPVYCDPSNPENNTTLATGGIVTYYGDYKVHTYLDGTSSFQVLQGSKVDILVVAGGGGGGSSAVNRSGGGGAGGMIVQSDRTVAVQSYSIVIGNGGAVGTKGQDSSALGLTAIGGGNGAGTAYAQKGGDGGSGGGGTVLNGARGIPTTGQGNYGGYGGGVNQGGSDSGAGGGGGAGGPGNFTTTGQLTNSPGLGGAGLQNDFRTGVNQWYAAGGSGGGFYYSALYTGGDGRMNGIGGGTGGRVCVGCGYAGGSYDGVDNTGSGGGGYSNAGGSWGPGKGGKGIVVIRYKYKVTP